ncbi:MAG: hypothetical protein O3C63_01110 [Cyanobacteria bacterium]|nr:hypothetical protein [Cyanobacteriota bacterium]
MIATSSSSAATTYKEAENLLGIRELSAKDRISFTSLVGCSRSRVAIASCPRDKDASDKDNIKLHQIELTGANQCDTVKIILDIFQTLSTKGLEIANFNFPGFAVQEDPEKAEAIIQAKIPNLSPGLYAVANVDLTDIDGKTPLHPSSNHLIDLPQELHQRSPDRRLVFIDSFNPPSMPYTLGAGKDLTVHICNDSVRTMLGALCSVHDKRIQQMIQEDKIASVGGFINGTGFGFGIGRNYNPRAVRFNEVVNDELGYQSLPDFLVGPLDRLEGDNKPVEVEQCFAGGQEAVTDFARLKGVRREIAILYNTLYSKINQPKERDDYLQRLAIYYNDAAEKYKLDAHITVEDIKASKLYKAFESGKATAEFVIPTNKQVVDFASADYGGVDKFTHMLILNLFARQGELIARTYKSEIQQMKLLAIAGNHVIDSLDRLKSMREAFMRPLLVINPELHLFSHALHGSEGLENMAVDMLRLSAGLVPHQEQPVPIQIRPTSQTGILGRTWAWIKSLFGA